MNTNSAFNDISNKRSSIYFDILLSFFEKGKQKLENYTYNPIDNNGILHSHDNCDDISCSQSSSSFIPIPIQQHQQNLLNEQIFVLNEIVNEYNNNSNNDTNITTQSVQSYLRLLGGNNNDDDNNNSSSSSKKTSSLFTNQEYNILNKAMKEMNEVARITFCKCIIRSEYYWFQQEEKRQKTEKEGEESNEPQQLLQQKENHNSNNNNSDLDDHTNMLLVLDYTNLNRKLIRSDDDCLDDNYNDDCNAIDRQVALEFCGLCTTAVKIPEIQKYIQSGIMDFADMDNVDISSYNEEKVIGDNTTTNHNKTDFTNTPQHRISHLQQMILCALGYEPSYGSTVLRKLMVTINDNDNDDNITSNVDDQELKEAFTTFLLTMQQSLQDALQYNLQNNNYNLSDEHEGGVTRVVSVKYSEREGNDYQTSSDAPINQRMDEQKEEMQREQLKMAQRAAQLQQSILNELDNMEEDERKLCLDDARESNERFIKDMMALSPMERVNFMQNIDEGLQKKLLMYKLWEGHRK